MHKQYEPNMLPPQAKLPDVWRELIAAGLLDLGMPLTCGVEAKLATVVTNGLQVDDQVFADPTDAMRHVLGRAEPFDNGWDFWKVEDKLRQFAKPLAHVYVAWIAGQGDKSVRTSLSHPLRVDSLAVPGLSGRIGMTICPGKHGDAIYGGNWQRDLSLDIQAIHDWGASAVVSLLEEQEFALLGIPEFIEVMARQPFAWYWLEIQDSLVPDERFEQGWPGLQPQLRQLLADGKDVVVHCRGGLGRTGLVVARFLVESGMSPNEAIALVRNTRSGAIETWEQEEYVRQRHWLKARTC